MAMAVSVGLGMATSDNRSGMDIIDNWKKDNPREATKIKIYTNQTLIISLIFFVVPPPPV